MHISRYLNVLLSTLIMLLTSVVVTADDGGGLRLHKIELPLTRRPLSIRFPAISIRSRDIIAAAY